MLCGSVPCCCVVVVLLLCCCCVVVCTSVAYLNLSITLHWIKELFISEKGKQSFTELGKG